MKRSVRFLAAVMLLQSPFSSATAPTNKGVTPTVTIASSDSTAHESGPDSASFTVTRSGGDTGSGLTVGISLTGSAVLGTDYNLTPAFVTAVSISANQDSVTVVLTPRADNLLEGKEQAGKLGHTPRLVCRILPARPWLVAIQLGKAGLDRSVDILPVLWFF